VTVAKSIAVYLETAPKRAFAVAVDWPGWARSGKTDADALAALVASAPRYAKVAKRAGEPFELPRDVDALSVVERIKGGSGTEFGVPSATPAADREPIRDRDLERLTRLLKASWATFDSAAKAAQGRTLRKGPRGGGRDLRKMVGHVLEAELAYVRQLGSAHKPAPRAAESDAMAAARKAEVEALGFRARGEPIPKPTAVKNPWEPRYFVRRSAWHVLDHAWEIEDRKE
jgi:hypothetical protein